MTGRRKRSFELTLELSPTIMGRINRIATRKGKSAEQVALECLVAELIKQHRAAEGQKAAKVRGVVLGRPATLDEQTQQTVRLLRNDGWTLRQISEMYGVSPTTISRVQ